MPGVPALQEARGYYAPLNYRIEPQIIYTSSSAPMRMELRLWMVLAAVVLVFLIAVKLMLLRALFRTKVLQWAKHCKTRIPPEAAWTYALALLLTLAILIGEFVKNGSPFMDVVVPKTWAGIAVLALGLYVFALAMDARKQYLWFWQVLAPKESIPPYSTTGIYATVRNPRDLGILLVLAGLALVFSLNIALVFVALLLLATMYRVSARDRALMEEHGKPYIDYTARSKKLIPYIY
jgi:protein-S-isoprenylcysteine O-methyltransferase Ste14